MAGFATWRALRRALYVSPVVLAFNENVASMCAVEGRSMQPTFNPEGHLLSDRVVLDKLSARFYTFQRGDVIVLRSPTEPHAHLIKRLLALPGDWVAAPLPAQRSTGAVLMGEGGEAEPAIAIPEGDPAQGIPTGAVGRILSRSAGRGRGRSSGSDIERIPKGHCWVEGDNGDLSFDSKNFGPVPLALVEGKVSYIVWPPNRFSKVQRRVPEGRIVRNDFESQI